MTFGPFQIKVPATTANLGPGFDSIGLAVQVYQTILVLPSSNWSISYEDESHQLLSTDNDNLIMSTIERVEELYQKTAPAANLTVQSDIPLSRGMGSSAAAIAAGITIADELLHLHLSEEEKVKIASDLEGHPDNVSAALAGGLTVSSYDEFDLEYVKLPTNEIGVIVLIPNQELSTSLSRDSIPEMISHKKSISSSAAANVLVSAIAANNWSLAGRMMEKDQFHEPFREKWIESFKEIRHYARSLGAYGCTISGAGPSIVIFCEEELLLNIQQEVQFSFPAYECVLTRIDTNGTSVSPVHLKENFKPPVK